MNTYEDVKRWRKRCEELELLWKRQRELTKAEQLRRSGWKNICAMERAVAALSRPQRQRPS
jgi:hypothetical protein